MLNISHIGAIGMYKLLIKINIQERINLGLTKEEAFALEQFLYDLPAGIIKELKTAKSFPGSVGEGE